MGKIRKRAIGAALVVLPALWQFALWAYRALDFAGNVDTALEASRNPEGLKRIGEFLLNPPGWMLLAIAITGLGLIAWSVFSERFRELSGRIGRDTSLGIEVGEDGQFSEYRRAAGMATHHRVLRVKVSNHHMQNTLTNCKLQIMSVEPREQDGPWVLAEGITLAPGDHQFVPLVEYGEPFMYANARGNTFMELLTASGRVLPAADSAHTVKLRATAVGSGFNEVMCKLWVDADSQKLKIEKL